MSGRNRVEGEKITFASIDYLDEATGEYQTVVSHIAGDATAAFNAIHNPPKVIVRSVRVA